VRELAITVTYTDVHAERLIFFQDMLKSRAVRWDQGRQALLTTEPFYLTTGRTDAADAVDCASFLEFLGSRLVRGCPRSNLRSNCRCYGVETQSFPAFCLSKMALTLLLASKGKKDFMWAPTESLSYSMRKISCTFAIPVCVSCANRSMACCSWARIFESIESLIMIGTSLRTRHSRTAKWLCLSRGNKYPDSGAVGLAQR
jgi:hypothetical protein